MLGKQQTEGVRGINMELKVKNKPDQTIVIELDLIMTRGEAICLNNSCNDLLKSEILDNHEELLEVIKFIKEQVEFRT